LRCGTPLGDRKGSAIQWNCPEFKTLDAERHEALDIGRESHRRLADDVNMLGTHVPEGNRYYQVIVPTRENVAIASSDSLGFQSGERNNL
jgi:hypothetical protein